ncbi:MAG: SRPBCC family protein, partial [Candidatus Binatia bacterium]
SWVYNLSGKLIGVPGMEGVKGFDASQLGLRPIRLEVWEGLIFVNFDPEAKPLLPMLGELPEYVKNYRLGETVCMRRTVYDYPCNWKLLVENAMEGYHILGTHATSIGSQYGDLSRWSIVPDPKGIWEDLLFVGTEPLSMSVGGSVGKSAFIIDSLTEPEQKLHHFIFIYPDVLLIYQPDSVSCFIMHPNGPDSVKCYFDVHFPKSFVGRPGFEEMVQMSYDGTDEFNHQDIHLLNLAQQGYRSRLASPSRLSLHELIPYRLTQYVLDHLLNGDASAR